MQDLDLAEVLSATDLGLSRGPVDILTAIVGGRVTIYALAREERTIFALNLSAGGLSVAGSLALDGAWIIGQTPALGYAEGFGLLVQGLDTAPRVMLDATGLPLSQTSAGQMEDFGAVARVGTGLFVAVDAQTGALGTFRTASGTGVKTGEVADDATTYLDRVTALASFVHGGATFVAAASGIEDGLTLLLRQADNSLAVAGSIGVAEGLPINDPAALSVVARGDGTQILVASRASKSLSVVTLTAEGRVEMRDHILDTSQSYFAGAAQLASVKTDGFVFVAVAGSEGGVTLLTLLPNGRLQHVESVADHGATTLYRPTGLSLEVLGDVLHLVVASEWDLGLTRLTLSLAALGAVIEAPLGGAALVGTSGDDQIMGSDVSDTLDGGGGDDILFDGSGRDVMKGGSGADLFVFAADGLSDRVMDFEPGVDRLDLSSFAFLHDISQVQIAPTPQGAVLSFSDEVIELFTVTGTPLPSGALTTADILDLDRPLLSVAGQSLKGGDADDVLIGGASGDTIQGGGGGDRITGAPGADLILGQDGSDTIGGGDGNDRLHGNAGDDAIRGDAGNDWIDGGDGADFLVGDGVGPGSEDFDWGGV